MWTKETVKVVLESNPNYNNLFKEFSGEFTCKYIINEICILIYNVGGMPEIFFSEEILSLNDKDKYDLQDFVKIANEILMEKAKLENI